MPTCVIPACKSLTISSKHPKENINDETIFVGKDEKHIYYSYLHFDTCILPDNIKLISADFVLFKENHFVKPNLRMLYIYPLINYFSSYTTYENPPSWNKKYQKEFYPFTKDVAVEANITDIVGKWLECKLPNQGLFLCFDDKCENIPLMYFGSAYSKDKTIIPFIRVCYEVLPYKVKVNHCIPDKKHKHLSHPCPPPEDTIGCILESIALEEAGLAHIINAEGEKIQRVVNDYNMDIDDLIAINESVNDTLKDIFKVESLLQFKLDKVAKILKELCEQKRQKK